MTTSLSGSINGDLRQVRYWKPWEKMSFYGQGKMEVVGTETVAGRKGFLCKLTGDEGPMGEWVIDPDLALPLRSKMYESSGFDGAVELVKYERL